MLMSIYNSSAIKKLLERYFWSTPLQSTSVNQRKTPLATHYLSTHNFAECIKYNHFCTKSSINATNAPVFFFYCCNNNINKIACYTAYVYIYAVEETHSENEKHVKIKQIYISLI